MVTAKKVKGNKNFKSKLLSKDENSLLDRLIDPDCKSIATTVVQLYLPDPPHYTQWIKKACGVLCLVEDRSDHHRSLRMYCLIRRKVIWEQKLHSRLIYRASTPFFHTLCGADNTQIGINFADETEAEILLRATKAYLLKKKASMINGSLKLDISSPQDFRLISRISWDKQRGFILHNINHTLLHTFLFGSDGERVNQRKFKQFDQHSRLGSFKKKVTKNDISLPMNAQLVKESNASENVK